MGGIVASIYTGGNHMIVGGVIFVLRLIIQD